VIIKTLYKKPKIIFNIKTIIVKSGTALLTLFIITCREKKTDKETDTVVRKNKEAFF